MKKNTSGLKPSEPDPWTVLVLNTDCPTCFVDPGQYCLSAMGNRVSNHHSDRHMAMLKKRVLLKLI